MTAAVPKLERTTFRTSRLMDFCSEKELVAQTGHQTETWPQVVLKELIDNALDACEEAGVAPEISVTVDDTGITVIDNGPGVPETVIQDILDFSIKVSSREAYIAPDRGAQGNALKTIVAMPFVLDGKIGVVEVEAGGVHHRIEFRVDAIRQEPVINHETGASEVKNGSKIRIRWPDLACSILSDAKSRFLQIADDYTWINPHLTITIDWHGERRTTAATATDWAKWKPSDPTSAHWYRPEHLERLVAGYIAHDADRDRDRTIREFVSEFRGYSGSAKQKVVLDRLGLHRAPLSSLVANGSINTEVITNLLLTMQENSKPVKPPALGIIGKDHFETRFAGIVGFEPESFQYRKVVDTTDGVPWIVETAFGWIDCDDVSRRLVTGVNWSPGILNPFRELGSYGQSLDTILSQQRIARDEPVILVLHMACPRVEYTDRGKSAVVIKR